MIKKNFLFLIIIILILTVSFELILRTFFPVYLTGSITAYEYDEDLGVKVKKNLSLIKLTDHRQEFITNNIGTFNFENDFEKYDRIIFALGDSYTQGTGVDPTSSYPFNLYMSMNIDSELNKNFGVLNLGLAAYGLEQSIVAAKKYFNHYKPDYLIFLGVSNDKRDDFLFINGYRHGHLVSNSPRFLGYGEYIGIISNNFEILKRLKFLYSELKFKSISNKTQTKNKIPAESNFDNYLKLIDLSKEFNSELIVSWYSCEDQQIQNFVSLKEWSKKNNVNFVDWCGDYNKLKNMLHIDDPGNNHSGGHYRPWVYRVIANNFAAKILYLENNN